MTCSQRYASNFNSFSRFTVHTSRADEENSQTRQITIQHPLPRWSHNQPPSPHFRFPKRLKVVLSAGAGEADEGEQELAELAETDEETRLFTVLTAQRLVTVEPATCDCTMFEVAVLHEALVL